MNKLKSSLAAKLIAVTLFVLLLMSLAVSVLDIAYIDSIDGYNYDYQTLLHKFKYDNSNDLNAVMYALGNGEAPEALNGRNGFYFVIRDYYTREVVFDGLGKRDYVWATNTTLFDLPAGYDLSAQDDAVAVPEPIVSPEPSASPAPSAPPDPSVSPDSVVYPDPVVTPAVSESPMSGSRTDITPTIDDAPAAEDNYRVYAITGYYTDNIRSFSPAPTSCAMSPSSCWLSP